MNMPHNGVEQERGDWQLANKAHLVMKDAVVKFGANLAFGYRYETPTGYSESQHL
jgi:hypothetical protein